MKAKRKMVVAHNEAYRDFNNLMELQSAEKGLQLPDKQQKSCAPSTSKLIETPYSITEINGCVNQTPVGSNNDNPCPDGKSIA